MDWQVGRIVYGPCTVTNGDMSKFTNGQIPARPVFEVGVKTVDTVARFKFDQKTGQYEPYFPCGYDERDAKV